MDKPADPHPTHTHTTRTLLQPHKLPLNQNGKKSKITPITPHASQPDTTKAVCGRHACMVLLCEYRGGDQCLPKYYHFYHFFTIISFIL